MFHSLADNFLQLGLPELPEEPPSTESLTAEDGEPSQILKDLHALLMETSVASGKLVCGNCGFEYPVKDGIASFLLPSNDSVLSKA